MLTWFAERASTVRVNGVRSDSLPSEISSPAGSLATGFASYFHEVWALPPLLLVSIGFILLLALVNYIGITESVVANMLMTFVEVAKPTLFERLIILGVQWVFYLAFFALYLINARTAHRVVGYFEEEAVISYTHYLAEIDEGRSANVAAPEIAKRYWNLPEDATLRDVVLVVRADEAHHRDVNHGFANELAGLPAGEVAECPPHVALEPIWKKAA